MWSTPLLSLLCVANDVFFIIWMAADVTGPLTDRYECLLWQENCCTIFLYWRWASYLNLVQSEDQRWVNKCHEQWAKPLNRSFVLKTNHCHFVNKETGSYAGICVGFFAAGGAGASSAGWMLVRHVITVQTPHTPHVTQKTAVTLTMWFSTTLSVLNTVYSVCRCMCESVVHKEILKVHVPM